MVSSILPCSAGKGLEHPTIVPLCALEFRAPSQIVVRRCPNWRTSNTPPRSLYSGFSVFFLASCHASFHNPAYLFTTRTHGQSKALNIEYNYQSELPICVCAQHFTSLSFARGRTVRPPRTCYSPKAFTQIPAKLGVRTVIRPGRAKMAVRTRAKYMIDVVEV
jgi:hypothetical protein